MRDFSVNSLIVDVRTKTVANMPFISRSILRDLKERKINIMHSFESTFDDNEIRFLRLFHLLEKNFTFSNNPELLEGLKRYSSREVISQKELIQKLSQQYITRGHC